MTNTSDLVLDDFMTRKVGDRAALIKGMVEMGWVPVTPERQPYVMNLIDQLMPALAAEGFTQVSQPVFTANKTLHHVATRMVHANVTATDKPEDLPDVNKELLPILLTHLRRLGHTHIYSVIVARTPVHGYLSPLCAVSTRSATVRAKDLVAVGV